MSVDLYFVPDQKIEGIKRGKEEEIYCQIGRLL